MSIRITNARWYPEYHIAPPSAWQNDVNGMCFYKGEYHAFYQHHPHSPQWGPMHWGHVVSRDLVHWRHLPIALAPGEPYDRDGCFSGSALEKDGKLYLIYTGHVGGPEVVQTQCLAVSEDGIHFEKFRDNPIVAAPDSELIRVGDFRDPKVWLHGDTCYMVVGASTPDKLLGQVLLYTSKDLHEWEFKSVMARAEGNQGDMWECPNFASIEGKDVLIISPQGIKREQNMYMNIFQSGYFLGKLDYETGIFSHGDFVLLDYGFDFYAPQIMQAPDGRTILIAWGSMWYSRMPEDVDGWAGMMTVPRELHIRNGKLVSVPVKELELLRIAEKSYENQIFYETAQLEGVEGETGELILDIDLAATQAFELELRASDDEKTVLSYDAALQLFKLNRDKAGAGGDGERECTVPAADKMNLRIFLDRSSVEVFINDGEAVMTSRIYPRADSTAIKFVPTSGTFKIDSVKFFTLGEGITQPAVD